MAIHNRRLMVAAAAAAIAFGAVAATAQGPGTAIYDVKAGVDAWAQGDFGGAVAKWRPWADKGDADAQYNLGQAYMMGRGVVSDISIARTWYEKAAQQGHPQAAAHLGLILFQNGQQKQAMPWLRKAADADDLRAEYVVGTALFNGDLLPKDWVSAYAYMTRAADQGLAAAQQNLESMNQYVPADQKERGVALARQIERANAGAGPAKPTRIAQAGPRTVLPSSTALDSTLPAGPPGVVTHVATLPGVITRSAPPPRVAEAAPAAVAHAAPPPRATSPARTTPRPAEAAPAAGGAWRVQLGAFSSAANAHKAWETLRGQVGALSGLRPSFGAAGAMTRLQATGLPSRAAADKVCAAAKAAGSACFPVAP
jgi:cell division septation protein DedD